MSDQAEWQSDDDAIEQLAEMLEREDETPVEEDNRHDDAEPDDEVEAEETEAKESDEDKPEPTEEAVEIEFEGKQYKLPSELKDALLRQADYTRKTQEVAEQRKEVETVKEQLGLQAKMQQQFLGHYAQLQSLDSQLAQLKQIDVNALIDSDPVQAMKIDRQMRELQEHKAQISVDLQTKQQQAYQQYQAWTQEQIAKGQEQLMKEIPGWGADLAKQIKNTVKDYGFNDEEMSKVTDPRLVKVLHDAMKYRQLQANKSQVEKKVAKASPVLKPSGKQSNPAQDRNNKQTAKLRQTGSLRDASRVMERFI
jgi:hypothetical protein